MSALKRFMMLDTRYWILDAGYLIFNIRILVFYINNILNYSYLPSRNENRVSSINSLLIL